MSRTKLELVWPNKDKVLLGLDSRGQPIWGTLEDVDTRPLIPQAHFGDPDAENILIKGDNLFALQALLPRFAGKIKCIYIDPPFNTGNAFAHYDDGLEHTIWLSLIMNRIQLLLKLLSEDGTLWIHLDESEHAYTKVCLDEIPGRRNYLATIVWRRRKSQANLAQSISVIHDFILVYANDPAAYAFNRINPESTGIGEFKNPDNDPRGPWQTAPCTNRGGSVYDIVTPTGKVHRDEWRFTPETFQRLLEDNRIVYPRDGNGKPRYKVFASEREGVIPSSWWDDVGSTQEAHDEMRALFGHRFAFDTPKPERLMERIITIASKPGDWVLDSFLGSGTTAAVAHKLGRRWIGIEMGDHADTHCLPRLQKVISGEDQSGISRAVGWRGGGGFTYYHLGPPIVTKDQELDIPLLHYRNGPLIEALCLRDGFSLIADGHFHGRKGRHLLHVTETFVTPDYLSYLLTQLPEDHTLTLYCTAHLSRLPKDDRLEIKRIPQALLRSRP